MAGRLGRGGARRTRRLGRRRRRLGRQDVAQRDLDREGADVDLGPVLIEPHADDAAVAVEVADADRVAGLEVHDALHPGLKVALLLFEQAAGLGGLADGLVGAELCDLGVAAGGLGLALGGGGTGHGPVQGLGPAREIVSGGLDEALGHAQALGDVDGVAHAGLADAQVIGGAVRLGVELDAAVLGPRARERKGLEGADVRGGDAAAAAAQQLVENGLADGGALVRVGTGADLVDQDERPGAGFVQHLHLATQMGAEGAERLLHALLIADVDEDVLEDAHDGAPLDGNGHAGLGHERQQADRLERDGLSAGVGAGDDQQVEIVAEAIVDRDDAVLRLAAAAAALHQVEQQRVAGAAYGDDRLVLDHRAAQVERLREAPLGGDQIEHRDRIQRFDDLLGVDVDLVAELPEQAGNLLRLLRPQVADAVVELDGAGRLDVERRTAVGAAVNDARQPAAVLGLDRQDHAVGVKGVVRVLQQAANVGVVQQPLDGAADVERGGLDLAADAGQLRAGVVAHVGPLIDDGLDAVGDGLEVADALRQVGQLGRLGRQVGQPASNLVRAGQRRTDAGDFLDPDAQRRGAAADGFADVLDAAEGRQAALLLNAVQLLELVEPAADELGLGDRADGQCQTAAERRHGVARQQLAHAEEIQTFERMIVHGFRLSPPALRVTIADRTPGCEPLAGGTWQRKRKTCDDGPAC